MQNEAALQDVLVVLSDAVEQQVAEKVLAVPAAISIEVCQPVRENFFHFSDHVVFEEFLKDCALREETDDPFFELGYTLQLEMDSFQFVVYFAV